MWIQTVLVFALIALSEESCQVKKNFTFRSIIPKFVSYISCTDINPDYDLYSDIVSFNNNSIETIIITNSSIPELTQHLFYNISYVNVNIEAMVEVIQSKTFQMCNISSLTLDNNNIQVIKNASFSATLQYLSLQNNSLSKIKNYQFSGLVNLKKLKLKYNQISDIEEDSFNSLTSLEELDLSFNRLINLHFDVFKNLTNLQTIYLNNNFMKGFSDKIFSQCTSLKYLNIENNRITAIDARQYPNSLLFINASNNYLNILYFSSLVNLDTMDLSFNSLTIISSWMTRNLPSLKFLYVNSNLLGPSINTESFQHLKNLTTIELDNNHLQTIDFELFNNLPVLVGVSLATNDLTNLNFTVLKAHLTMLNLSGNSLNDIRNLTKLQELIFIDFSYNQLEEIKYETFENMSKVKQLLLQYNSIHSLQLGCFRDLIKLQELNLGHNKIMIIEPGAFTGLNALASLDLSYNNVSHIDENSFHNTKQLMKLNIAYNNLKNVEIRKVLSHAYVRQLDLNGNNWTCKSLAELVRRFPFIMLTHGKSFNVTNVYGIACNNSDDGGQSSQVSNSVNVTKYLSFIEEHSRQVSNKMTVNNVVLILLLIILCVKFNYVKCSPCFTLAQQFFYSRYRNEQEMQLT